MRTSTILVAFQPFSVLIKTGDSPLIFSSSKELIDGIIKASLTQQKLQENYYFYSNIRIII
jgi:hypothetical protein